MRAVELSAIEKFFLGMRVDEETTPAVHEAEPHRAVDEPAVPGHRQILVRDGEPPDVVVAHAVVFGKDDVDGVAAFFQLAAEAEDDVAEPACLRDRRALRSDKYDIHRKPIPFAETAALLSFRLFHAPAVSALTC